MIGTELNGIDVELSAERTARESYIGSAETAAPLHTHGSETREEDRS